MAVNNVSLSVDAGERRAIIGPNGAGKTTLFNLITGWYPASTGRIYLLGQDITNMPVYRRPHLGLGRTFQINNLFLEYSVLDNVLLGIKARQKFGFQPFRHINSYKEMYHKAAKLLEDGGLLEKRNVPVAGLSYGEQRQLEITLALASDPKVLMMDEPTAGLSSAETASVVNTIKSFSLDITTIIIAHDMDVVFEVADRITVLHYGEVLAEGSGAEIQAHPKVEEIYLGREEAF
jgi:branched-chain amino acid transport system ATP-binding protein